MNRRGNMMAIITLVGMVVGLVIALISLHVQMRSSNAAAYEQTIEDSCQARGYDHSAFTDNQPLCCRLTYCVGYETAMQYGPGYEPVGGASAG